MIKHAWLSTASYLGVREYVLGVDRRLVQRWSVFFKIDLQVLEHICPCVITFENDGTTYATLMACSDCLHVPALILCSGDSEADGGLAGATTKFKSWVQAKYLSGTAAV